MCDGSGSAAQLVFGTVSLGLSYGLPRTPGEQPPQPPALEDAVDLIRAAFERGIRTFDTAPVYGDAEARLGAALGNMGTIWTKLDAHLRPDALPPDRALDSVERSLQRLRRKRIEVLQWHNWIAPLLQTPGFRACWRRLADDTRVAELGATTYGVADAVAAVESGLFSTVQVEWNLLNQRVVRAVGPVARSHHVKIAVRSVFLQGVLTNKGNALPAYLRGLAEPRVRAARLAEELGMELYALALRAALDHPSIDFVLVGMDQRHQLDAAVRVARAPRLDAKVWSAISELDLDGAPLTDPSRWARA